MNLIELTKTLIDIPSVTGDEAAVAGFLASYLEGLGYKMELQQVENDRRNLIAAVVGPPEVVFSTHMDTVPPHIPSSEDEQYVYGRGACDAKGIIAAQIFAAERLRAHGIDRVGLLFTVDEEMGSMGARVANEHLFAARCRYLINGEPTDNRLAIGTKGSIRVRLSTEGRAAHSAYPDQGESAIERLLDVLGSVRELEWPADPLFGETTCNIGVIAGGVRPNVVPAEAHADLQIRLAKPASTVMSKLSETVAKRAKLEFNSSHDPVRLHSLEGFDQCVVSFTTDIPYLPKWGEALLLGPGSILDAHSERERVSKTELERAVELYSRLARGLVEESVQPASQPVAV